MSSGKAVFLMLALFVGIVYLFAGCIGEDGSAAQGDAACDCPEAGTQADGGTREVPRGTVTMTAGDER